MIELTVEQRQAVDGAADPVRVVDPASHREYVLVRAEVFDKMKRALEAEVIDPSFYEFEEPSPRP